MKSKAATIAASLAAALAFLPAVCADYSGADDVAQAQQNFQQVDNALNQAYHAEMAKLSPAAQASLKSLQRSWIAFKEDDFAIFERLSRGSGDDTIAYRYETGEEQEQTNALNALGQPSSSSTIYDEQQVSTSQVADQMLNSVYRQIIGTLPPDLGLAEKSAEASWIRFRDLYCQLDASLKGGTTDDSVLRDITLRRAEQLGHYGDVLLKAQLPMPDGASSPREESDEKETDPPAADPFRFAK